MRLLRATLFFIIVTIIDIFLTLRGLSERPEGNPIIRYYMEWIGPIPGLVLTKLILIGGAVFLLAMVSRKGGKAEAVLYAGTIVTLLLSSMWLI